MNYTNLILVILTICTFYNLFIKKEGMSNASIRKAITDIYQADINSIRNLSKLANDLTSNGRLNIPGGLTIQGDLNVGGRVQANVSRKAKDDMFRVFHPDGGYLYFNKGGTLGTWKIPKKSLTVSAGKVNATNLTATNLTATNLTATNLTAKKIVANSSIYSANTVQAEKGLHGGFLKVYGHSHLQNVNVRTINGRYPLGRGDLVKIHSRAGHHYKGRSKHFGFHVSKSRKVITWYGGDSMELV